MFARYEVLGTITRPEESRLEKSIDLPSVVADWIMEAVRPKRSASCQRLLPVGTLGNAAYSGVQLKTQTFTHPRSIEVFLTVCQSVIICDLSFPEFADSLFCKVSPEDLQTRPRGPSVFSPR